MKTLFSPGKVVSTRSAADSIPEQVMMTALARHLKGDWGDLTQGDWRRNENCLRSGGRLFSVYHAPDGTKFYIITEADRSATTVLLPDEY